jgi:hypothetical protein
LAAARLAAATFGGFFPEVIASIDILPIPGHA